jgi:protein phosphatase
MRHVLTMAIGSSTSLKIHTYSLARQPGAQILLSSDGRHGVVGEEIIAEALRSKRTSESKCHYLVEAARRAGGPDNITVVLLRAAETA